MENIAVHPNPVRRDRANFLIHARVEEGAAEYWEQLWVRRIAEDRFEICCIPFFVYDLALGDEVETGPFGEYRFVVQRVVKASGHYTFRVWFGESKDPAARQEVLRKMEESGYLVEWSSPNLLAIDTSKVLAQPVADFLYEGHTSGRWIYEPGKLKG